MTKEELRAWAEDYARPILEELHLELWDVEFLREGKDWVLRFYIDKPGGVTIDDCEAASERISRELDRTDPIPHHYLLEVSSPGAERPLRTEADYTRYQGHLVQVSLFAPLEGKKLWKGQLVGLQGEEIVIMVKERGKEKTVRFPRSTVAQVRLALEF